MSKILKLTHPQKIVAFIFILISFFLVSFGQNEGTKEETSTTKKFTSLHKSLLFPGWGQIAEKRYIEGVLFFSAEVFSLYKIFSYNHKGNKYYDKYKKANNVDDAVQFRDLTEEFDKKRNIFTMVAVGIWAVNLIDTYVIVKGKEKKRLKLKLESSEDKKLAFTVSYSF